MSENPKQKIGVIGAGTMGAGIAQVAAQSGFEVLLYDIAAEVVEGARERIAHFIARLAEKGKLSPEEADAATARLATSTSLAAMRDASFVIEAAPERLELKKQLFNELEAIVRPDTILASNTSTLSITQIGAATASPERVVGMHFFNPPPLLPLVEVIAGAATAPAVVEATLALARAMGKSPVRVKDTPGFIVNRVARPFHLEALRLLEQGVADPATLDRLVRAGGFRMGPFELQDLIGIDINYAASQSVYDAFHHAPRFRPSPLQRQQVESGQAGEEEWGRVVWVRTGVRGRGTGGQGEILCGCLLPPSPCPPCLRGDTFPSGTLHEP